MTDLIRRADAIAFINSGISLDTDADREYATEMLKNIPSAELPKGDLIRRADAIEAVCMANCGGCRPNECAVNDICDAVNALSALPSAEQVTGKLKKPCASLLTGDSDECKEQKSKLESADAVQGEWIDVENEPFCECSVCGAYIDNLDDDYAFCPCCGAKMKGGAE